MSEAVVGIIGVVLGVILDRGVQWIEQGKEVKRQRQAVARALLFETVSYYTYYYRYLRPILNRLDTEHCPPPSLSVPSSDFFAVYRGNACFLGGFGHSVVEKVVRFYRLAEWLFTSIREYAWSLDRELERQENVATGSAPRRLLKQAQDLMYHTDTAAVEAIRTLSESAGVSYDSLRFNLS